VREAPQANPQDSPAGRFLRVRVRIAARKRIRRIRPRVDFFELVFELHAASESAGFAR
jgi:hypothetical protein